MDQGKNNTQIFLWNTHDLAKIIQEHPKYTKIYVNTVESKEIDGEGSTISVETLSLSKNSGEFLYLVSNTDFDDLKLYFSKNKKDELFCSKNENSIEPVKTKNEPPAVKKAKQQQTLQSFFKTN